MTRQTFFQEDSRFKTTGTSVGLSSILSSTHLRSGFSVLFHCSNSPSHNPASIAIAVCAHFKTASGWGWRVCRRVLPESIVPVAKFIARWAPYQFTTAVRTKKAERDMAHSAQNGIQNYKYKPLHCLAAGLGRNTHNLAVVPKAWVQWLVPMWMFVFIELAIKHCSWERWWRFPSSSGFGRTSPE